MRYPFDICSTNPNCGPFGTTYPDSPYVTCERCGMWFQHPLPPKTYEAAAEKGPDGKTAIPDKQTLEGSAGLATLWYHNWLKKIKSTPRCLDIGAKYPYFSYTLKNLGCTVWAIDGMDFDTPGADPVTTRYQQELGVDMLLMDFERTPTDQILKKTGGAFNGISMIHVFEHMYEPHKALRKLYDLLLTDGLLLLRMPDRSSPRRHLHMKPQHFEIHPYYYSPESFEHVLKESQVPFKIVDQFRMPEGAVMDFMLRKN